MDQNEKWICALAYVIFFIPFVVDKDKETYKFHGNQGLNLFILGIIVGVVGSVVPIIGWFIVLPLGGIACLVFAVMGIMNAYNGRMKELPLIGKFRLVK